MLKLLYNKYQFFLNLLIAIFFWCLIRTIQWIDFQPDRIEYIFKYTLFDILTTVLISFLFIIVYKWVLNKKSKILVILTFILLSSASSSLWVIISNCLKYILWPTGFERISFGMFKKATYSNIIFFFTLSGIYFLTRFRIQYSLQKEATLRAETLAKDTQLKMLRYQINPHFLFNIFNSLHALIDEDTSKAKQLVIDLSEYYRFTLGKKIHATTVENEIEIIKKYLEIQKIRFEEKFEFEILVSEQAKKIGIPIFIIHLLVENAVKYGIKQNGQKLIIKLSIYTNKESLFIEVANTGVLRPDLETDVNLFKGTGNGIDNILERLKLYYNDDYSFSLTGENGWVFARIEIKKLTL
jgi:two-component system LytT family sensor kinase